MSVGVAQILAAVGGLLCAAMMVGMIWMMVGHDRSHWDHIPNVGRNRTPGWRFLRPEFGCGLLLKDEFRTGDAASLA
jgi:hypothetical protein